MDKTMYASIGKIFVGGLVHKYIYSGWSLEQTDFEICELSDVSIAFTYAYTKQVYLGNRYVKQMHLIHLKCAV